MSDLPAATPSSSFGPPVLARAPEVHWYAAYTNAQHEKSVVRQLELRAIESYLPLYEKMSRWKDRQVKVQLPLFSGYVFVRMALEEKVRVLQVPGLVRLVGFSGQPTALPEEEMEALRRGLCGALHAEPCPYLQVGSRIRLKSGPLRGTEGVLLKKKNGYRFVISLELIQRSIAVEVDAVDVAAA
jgi:transcription antitermination factor NusG